MLKIFENFEKFLNFEKKVFSKNFFFCARKVVDKIFRPCLRRTKKKNQEELEKVLRFERVEEGPEGAGLSDVYVLFFGV